MEEEKVIKTFLYMILAYLDFEGSEETGLPAVREYGILNNGMIRIRERKAGVEKFEKEESIKADVYDLAILFGNIKHILESDRWDKETITMTTKTTDVRFEIVYSQYGHAEKCSPFLCDNEGRSIVGLIDGFIAFARQEHTYYNWYEVSLSDFSDKTYSYFYDDDSIKIGDRVIVPVGKDNKEKLGKVVNFWRIAEEHLSYPAKKTKKIIRKVEPFSVDSFLKTVKFTRETNFEFTDVDGMKYKGIIYGDYREDPDAKEPYLKCILGAGTVVEFVERRIVSIKKLNN